jgi:beta-N-acetylhexosaminidase
MLIPLRARHRGVAVLVLALAAVACGGDGPPATGLGGPTSTVAAPGPPATSATPTSTTQPCRPAPLEARAATVLAVGINDATTAEAPLVATVASLGVGGVILLGQNILDADQARALIAGMRQQSPRGLLVAVDEEGGRVSRLRPILGSTPSARTLGQRPLADIATVAAERGRVLRDLGFDLVLAPVVDADGGPAGGAVGDRAFATTPAEAGPRAAAFADGVRRAGVAATAKHFPGQGGLADSHDGEVVSDTPLAELRAAATAGFGPVVGAGVGAVMMSHVTYRALGPLPASLEPAAYRLLRSLGFSGVAITDAVGMEAIVEQWSLPEAAVLALKAGADLVLATPGDKAAAMRDGVVAAVADGRLPESRLDEAVGRVLALRGEDPRAMVCR